MAPGKALVPQGGLHLLHGAVADEVLLLGVAEEVAVEGFDIPQVPQGHPVAAGVVGDHHEGVWLLLPPGQELVHLRLEADVLQGF